MTPLGPPFALGAILAAAAPAAGAIFYVNNGSPACSDTGPGSQATPYCTISAALTAQHLPGTTIIVMPGVYREQVSLSASGTSASPITLQAEGAPLTPVVVDGSDDFSGPAKWAPYSGTVYRAAGVTWSPKQAFADGARLTPSTAAPNALPVKAFTWVSGQGLYVNLGGDNPGLHQILVGHRLFAFHVTGCSWVVIDGFMTPHCEWSGFEIDGASSQVTVSNGSATFESNYGIQVDNSSLVAVTSCVASDNLWSGIGLTAGSTNCSILNNQSFHNLTADQANGIYDFGAPGNLIQGNLVHDNAYNGIFMSKGADYDVLIQNQSWSNAHQGIEDITCTGNHHVGDVSWGNAWNGFAIEGGASGITLNDCIASNNNTVAGFYAELEVDPSSTTGFTSDDNVLWNLAGRAVVIFNGARYTALSDFVAATGQDTRSIQGDPRFADPDAGDFHPQAGSSAIDNANSGVAYWPLTDAEGQPRRDDPYTPNSGLGPVAYADRGALEYQPGASGTIRRERRVPTEPEPDGNRDGGHVGASWPAAARSSALASSVAPPRGLAADLTPNPIRGSATLAFTLSRPGPVHIRLYDIESRLVRSLRDLPMGSAGRNVVSLDAHDDDGVALRSGVYLYEIQAGAERASGRLVVVR